MCKGFWVKSVVGIILQKEMSASDCALLLGMLQRKRVSLLRYWLLIYVSGQQSKVASVAKPMDASRLDSATRVAYRWKKACHDSTAQAMIVKCPAKHCFQVGQLLFTWEFVSKLWKDICWKRNTEKWIEMMQGVAPQLSVSFYRIFLLQSNIISFLEAGFLPFFFLSYVLARLPRNSTTHPPLVTNLREKETRKSFAVCSSSTQL